MKLGQRVKGVKFPKDDKYNPRDCAGTVTSLDGKYSPIIVKWDNGFQNSYSENDLEKVFSGGRLSVNGIGHPSGLNQTEWKGIDDFES